ncbi:MAG: type II CAAX endopeptidase family protein [Chthoniobacteraceae bacterium]
MAPTVLNPLQQAAITAVSLALLITASVVYARLWLRLRREGGRVLVGAFDLPDLLVSFVLASFFGGLVVKEALRHAEETPLSPEHVLPSSLIFGAFVVGLAAFLAYRGLRVTEIFGLARLGVVQVCGWAALLLVAAIPFVGAVNAITVVLMKDDAEQQPLVELFRSAAEHGDLKTIATIALAGVVLAPLCEEFLFRGYFYAVGKRYVGAWISGLATAALFAAFHASLTSLAGLFVLAIALTLAYERTGTLAVPITMHALFNATSLGVLYLQATNRLPK